MMKLTPIRVRGRRGKHPDLPSVHSASKRKAGEDSDGASSLSQSAKKNKSRRPKDRGGGQLVKGVPLLLQLPQEILERVCIASQNLELAHVNRELYQRLSSNLIRKQHVMTAFGPTWDEFFGVDRDNAVWLCHPPDVRNTKGNPEKQASEQVANVFFLTQENLLLTPSRLSD